VLQADGAFSYRMGMIDRPRTRFTRAGNVSIAYQVVGEGPVDLVYASGWLSNIDVVWENPGYRAFLNEIASFGRLILFDKRGTGMSDRNVGAPTLEDRAEDIRAVMDAVDSEQATIFGVSEGGNMTCMFAATYPERVRSIILIACRPRIAWSVDWPSGWRKAEFEDYMRLLDTSWGEEHYLDTLAPSIATDPEEQAFMRRLLTQSASPGSAAEFTQLWYEMDVRHVLPAISCPALSLRRRDDRSVLREHALYLAENIPNGRFLEIDGQDHLPWAGDMPALVDEMRKFVLAEDAPAREDRVLLSVLMTDIVASTAKAAETGDAAWAALMERHDAAVGRSVARHDGNLVKLTGDGVLATFSGPSRALACAREVREIAKGLGLQIRAGVHAGECLRRGDDVSGMAVNLASRIMDGADAGEVRVSGTVRDLVVGSGLEFESLGQAQFRGVPGDWPLNRLA